MYIHDITKLIYSLGCLHSLFAACCKYTIITIYINIARELGQELNPGPQLYVLMLYYCAQTNCKSLSLSLSPTRPPKVNIVITCYGGILLRRYLYQI